MSHLSPLKTWNRRSPGEETFDTNIVVRLIVEDDEDQSRRAEIAWRSALAGEGVFLPKVVLVEAAWVLRTAYRFDSATVAKTLCRLLDVDGVKIEDEIEVRQALTFFEEGAADFSDYVILETANQARALPVRTFDRRFAREDDVELLAK